MQSNSYLVYLIPDFSVLSSQNPEINILVINAQTSNSDLTIPSNEESIVGSTECQCVEPNSKKCENYTPLSTGPRAQTPTASSDGQNVKILL